MDGASDHDVGPCRAMRDAGGDCRGGRSGAAIAGRCYRYGSRWIAKCVQRQDMARSKLQRYGSVSGRILHPTHPFRLPRRGRGSTEARGGLAPPPPSQIL